MLWSMGRIELIMELSGRPGSSTSGRPGVRPRSPSPFLNRSRSLNTRKKDQLSRHSSSIGLDRTDSQNTLDIDQDEVIEPIVRANTTLSSSKWSGNPLGGAPKRTPRQRREGHMSTSELPPIAPRPASGRRSSKDSNSSGLQNGIVKFERPALISVDTDPNNGVKRSHLSPNSNSSSASNGGGLGNRAKSWCNDAVSPASNTKLETLFERNGVTQNSIMRQNTSVTMRATRSRHNSNNSSSPANASNLTQGKRTKSNSNLTKTSDNSKYNNTTFYNGQSRRTSIPRIQSEQALNTSMQNGNLTARSNNTNKPAGNNNNKQKSLRHVQSQPAMKQSKSDPTLNAKNLRGLQNGESENNGGDDSDSDCEKKDRIIQWLIGVGEEPVECPPEPQIEEDEPPQTDTAIHVVYGQD